MLVHVLLYDAGQDSEGIHSLELSGQTVVLMFENKDDAERYAGLLEAQDFPTPTVEALDQLSDLDVPMDSQQTLQATPDVVQTITIFRCP